MSNVEDLKMILLPSEVTSYQRSEASSENLCLLDLDSDNVKFRSKKEEEYLRDVWAVQQVSYTFHSVSRPSETIERVKQLHKANHDNALEALNDELENLQELCKAEIGNLKRNLRLKINSIRQVIKEKQNNFCQVDIANYEYYEKFKRIVEQMLDEEISLVGEYFKYIDSVVCKYQNDAVNLFEKCYVILQKTFYMRSEEIKDLLGKRILEYNTRASVNKKRYDKSKVKYKCMNDKFREAFSSWMHELKRNKIDTCLNTLRAEFNAAKDSLELAGWAYLQSMEGRAAFCRLKSRKTLITETLAATAAWDTDSDLPYTCTRLDSQSRELDRAILSIESVIKGFIGSYRKHVTKRVCRLYDLLRRVQDLEEMGEAEECGSTDLQGIYESERQRVSEYLAELEDVGEVVSKSLKDKALETVNAFKAFGCPWDDVSREFLKLRDSVARQLETKAAKHATYHVDLQKSIDQEVESLRQQPSRDSLDKKLNQVFGLVDRKEKRYKSDYEEQCKVINRCEDFVRTEGLGIAKKIQSFLGVNGWQEEGSEGEESSLAESMVGGDQCLSESNADQLIAQELKLIGDQVDSFDVCKSNFSRALALYEPRVEEGVADMVSPWHNELLIHESLKLDNDLRSVDRMRENIRKGVYEPRARELIDHQNKLLQHKQIIGSLITESAKCADTFLSFDDIIDNYKSESLEIVGDFKAGNVKNSSQLTCLINMLASLREGYRRKIDTKIGRTAERMAKKISLMKDYNDDLLAEAVPFQIGGCYTTDELNSVKKLIDQSIKDIRKDESDGQARIKKAKDNVAQEMETFHASIVESLCATKEKLRVAEDIAKALEKCEYFVGVRNKRLEQLATRTINDLEDFVNKCRDRSPIGPLLECLNRLIESMRENFNFIRQPLPNINVPAHDKYRDMELKVLLNNNKNKGKKTQSRGAIPAVKAEPMIVEQEGGYSNDYASVAKLIQDAILIIDAKATNYYTALKHKREHSDFPDNNTYCENCIDESLQRINYIYATCSERWTEEAIRLLKFFNNVKIPSIECYLLEQDPTDKDGGRSISYSQSECHNCISVDIENNFMKFHTMFQEMSELLKANEINASEELD